jgi:hypothetical protein
VAPTESVEQRNWFHAERKGGEREKGSVAVIMKYLKELFQSLPVGLNKITMKY